MTSIVRGTGTTDSVSAICLQRHNERGERDIVHVPSMSVFIHTEEMRIDHFTQLERKLAHESRTKLGVKDDLGFLRGGNVGPVGIINTSHIVGPEVGIPSCWRHGIRSEP